MTKGAHTKRPSREFRWSPAKREAVKLLVQGWSVRQIGERIGVHFTTVQRWKGHSEFRLAVLRLARDKVATRRFRRAYVTGVIVDQLEAWAMRLVREVGASDSPTQAQLKQVALFLREYRAYRRTERDDHDLWLANDETDAGGDTTAPELAEFEEWLARSTTTRPGDMGG